MKITGQEVEKIALLARLELSEAEKERYARELSEIISYVERLNELDLTRIEPTAHAVFVPTPLREDRVVPDSTKEESLAAAPDREDDFFRVPKVI